MASSAIELNSTLEKKALGSSQHALHIGIIAYDAPPNKGFQAWTP